MIEKYHSLTLFKVHMFNPQTGDYSPLCGLRTLAWINAWRAAAKKFDYHTNIITTPFFKYHLINR